MKCLFDQNANDQNANDQNERRARKRRKTDTKVDDIPNKANDVNPSSDNFTVKLAEVGQLRAVVGWVLFIGIKGSDLRKEELRRNQSTLTNAFELCFPFGSGDDFKMRIHVSCDVGEEVARAKEVARATEVARAQGLARADEVAQADKDLENMLGEWLSHAIDEGKFRYEERSKGISLGRSQAVMIWPNNGDGWMIEMMIGFIHGQNAYRCFPD